MDSLCPDLEYDTSYFGGKVVVGRADITKFTGDVIVNAANEMMLGGGGVDGAIHRAAGPELLDECMSIHPMGNGVRCPVGQAVSTCAYRLPCRRVIHTVGPDCISPELQTTQYTSHVEMCKNGNWRTIIKQMTPVDLLTNCYSNVLEVFSILGYESIAFPSIATGIYAFPVERAARIAASVIGDYVSRHTNCRVYFCLRGVDTIHTYEEAFKMVASDLDIQNR